MEFMLHNCPMCQKDLNESATYAGGETYCSCGWSSRGVHDKASRRDEHSRAKSMGLIALALILLGSAYIYLSTIPGQIFIIRQKVSFGFIEPEEMKVLSDRCLQMGDETCALNALKAASLMQPEKLELLQDLARFQMQVKQYAEAAITYKTYLEKGGEDQDVVYRVGRALSLAGERQEARLYFEQALNDHPDSVNLSATKGLIRLYIEEGDLTQARNMIADFQKKTNSGTAYFSDELKMLEMATN